MRQRNGVGTQYRSGIYTCDGHQRAAAKRSKELYQGQLSKRGYRTITTEFLDASVSPSAAS